ncbi:MAG: glutathione-disulfide reductase [Paracoccaceae bacterium]
MRFEYDLFVIGGGSGGVRAARVAAQNGAKVGLAEEDRYGGTCVIRGCVPKKLMVFASGYAPMMEDAVQYGWARSDQSFDWPSFKAKMHAELDRLENIYQNILKSNAVETFDRRAKLVGPHTVELDGGKQITSKYILIATGGRPALPDIKGSHLGMSSDEVFHLKELPASLLVVGGGYIACEFAGVFNGLGVDVTQYYRGTQILRGFDNEARGLVSEEMCQRGINLQLETQILEMEERKGKIWTKNTDGQERLFDKVMFATGRIPNSKNLNLGELGIETGPNGEITVDAYSQSSVPSIYAIGDVTNRMNLTPVAIREAMAFVKTVFEGRPTKADYDLVPTAIFTQPELGTVGLSEEEAGKKEPIEVYAASFRPMQTGFAKRPDKVLMKLVVSTQSRKVLGCHIVAPGAGEMIQLAAIAVKMGATKEDFDQVVAVHPTMAEEIVTMQKPVRSQ